MPGRLFFPPGITAVYTPPPVFTVAAFGTVQLPAFAATIDVLAISWGRSLFTAESRCPLLKESGNPVDRGNDRLRRNSVKNPRRWWGPE